MKSLLVIISLLGSVGYAMEWTGQFDMRQQPSDSSAVVCSGTCKTDTQMQFTAGATTTFDMGSNFAIRTGGLITQRSYKQTDTGVTDSINFMYVDVPVLPEYAINETFTAYAGVVVGLKANSTCNLSGGSCSGFDDKTLVTPFQVGGTYAINKQWNAHLTYETGTVLTTTPAGFGSSDLKTANAIAVGAGYVF